MFIGYMHIVNPTVWLVIYTCSRISEKSLVKPNCEMCWAKTLINSITSVPYDSMHNNNNIHNKINVTKQGAKYI